MDTLWSRGNSLFATAVAVLGVCAVANHGTSYFYPVTPTAQIELEKIHEFTVNTNLKADQATLGFNLNANLTSVMQWNAKLLYTYVVASYSTQKAPRNEVTLWDDMIEYSEESVINIERELTDYPLRDSGRLLKARNVTLSFRFRYIPIMGLMKRFIVAQSHFETPHEYFRYQPQSNYAPDSTQPPDAASLPPRYKQLRQRQAMRGELSDADDYDVDYDEYSPQNEL